MLAGLGACGLSASLPRALAQSGSSERRMVVLIAAGGWDVTFALDPKLASLGIGAFEEKSEEPREGVVRYRDPLASDVRIAGDFNGWVPDKGVRSLIESEGQTRVWTKILQLPPGTYQYRYVVDGEWREDPENPEVVSSALGGRSSVLVVR